MLPEVAGRESTAPNLYDRRTHQLLGPMKKVPLPAWATRLADSVSSTANSVFSTAETVGDAVADSAPDAFGEAYDRVEQIINNALNAYSTSAFSEQLEEAERTRKFNADEAQKAREFSANEAQKERLFQSVREDSAYQRLVADLKAAGLNPILAFGQGGSVSTSTGSYAMPSTVAASGSQASLSSAKNADKLDLDDVIPVLLLPLIQSVMKIGSAVSERFSLTGRKK